MYTVNDGSNMRAGSFSIIVTNFCNAINDNSYKTCTSTVKCFLCLKCIKIPEPNGQLTQLPRSCINGRDKEADSKDIQLVNYDNNS